MLILLNLFFLIAGIVFFFKKKVGISKNRNVIGKKAQFIGITLMLPYLANFAANEQTQLSESAINFIFYFIIALDIFAILTILYFVFFSKKDNHNEPIR
jgi:hypothetical protein